MYALLEPTRPALVSVCLVHGARPAPVSVLAHVGPIPPDAPFEEAAAAVAGVDAVVLARAPIAAHLAGNIQNPTFSLKNTRKFEKY